VCIYRKRQQLEDDDSAGPSQMKKKTAPKKKGAPKKKKTLKKKKTPKKKKQQKKVAAPIASVVRSQKDFLNTM